MIFRIARKELEVLFYSPIAWLLLLCYIIQSGISFCDTYEYFLQTVRQHGGFLYASNFAFVRDGFDSQGLLPKIMRLLTFYIPFLTMGIIGREMTSGSIKLLYSSPVRNYQIILGKYAALVVFALILTGTSFINIIYGWCTIDYFEIKWVLAGWLGTFLLACTYLAIGLFISSLTSYQLIAAIVTIMVLGLLSIVGDYGQEYAWVRDITYWLSMRGRTETFIQGMICSEDVIYFLIVPAMFLSFAIIRLKAVRQGIPFWQTALKNVGVIVIVCLLAIVTSRPACKFYYDATATKRNTILPVSQDIVSQLDGGLSLTCYVNILAPYYSADFQYPGFEMKQREIFEKYTRFKPETKLNIVYYYAEITEEKAAGRYDKKSAHQMAMEICRKDGLDSTRLKTKEEIDQMVDLSEEGYVPIWLVERENGQKQWLRAYYFGTQRIPTEAEITMALKRFVVDMPVMAFVTGHGERSVMDEYPMGYSFVGNNKKVKTSLWNQGFDITQVSLAQPVPAEVSVLTIPDPRQAFTPDEERNLREFIDRGGNLLLLFEPDFRDVYNPMLRKLLGLEITPKIVENRTIEPQILASTATADARNTLWRLAGKLSTPVVGGVEKVEDRGFQFFPIATTDTAYQAWTELETTDFVDDTVRFNPQAGEISKQFTTVLGMTRQVNGKEQRILVVGDADCLSNDELGFVPRHTNGSNNSMLPLSLANWLSYEKAPINTDRGVAPDKTIHVTGSSYSWMKFLFLYFLPLFTLGLGVFIWLRRRSN